MCFMEWTTKNNLCPKRWHSLEVKEILYAAEQKRWVEKELVVLLFGAAYKK